VKVPFLDVAAAYAEISDEIEPAVLESLRSGRYIGGQAVEAFEQAYAEYVGASCCVGLGSGLDAVHLALRALGIGPGDEVIVPANTFIGTWLGVTHSGATPVPVEPFEDTYNMDPQLAEAAVSGRTKAIVPVHLFGQPADLDGIMEIAGRHGLKVVEDAAQAHGARYRGTRIGARGHVVAWSFYPAKNLGALGDAGAVTTNDPDIASRVRKLGNYGTSTKYTAELIGFNSRMDPIQARALLIKLKYLDDWNDRRRAIAGRYTELLGCLDDLALPTHPDWAESVWHQYVVRHPDRNSLQQRLAMAGVETMIHYPYPPHLQAAYAGMGYGSDDFPRSSALAAQILSLPIGPQMSAGQVDTVVDAVTEAVGMMEHEGNA
jgi:dTDP-4-amino-4,6-dideoxygalactose transaminase